MTRLAGPVGRSSRVQRRADVVYTEVEASPVLCDPVDRSLHVLSPAAALIWDHLDGRPLEVHRRDSAGGWSELDLIELVRRLRALGLVEDATDEVGSDDPRGPVGDPAPSPAMANNPIELAGRVDAVGSDVLVVMDPWPGSGSIRCEADGSKLASDPRRIRALALVDSQGEAGRLEPVDSLRAIVRCVAPPALVVGPLDDLARIAETIPTFRAPDSSTLHRLVTDLAT